MERKREYLRSICFRRRECRIRAEERLSMKEDRVMNKRLDAVLKQSRAEPVAILRTYHEQMIDVLGGMRFLVGVRSFDRDA